MKKIIVYAALLLQACGSDQPVVNTAPGTVEGTGLTLVRDGKSVWQYENLQIYAVTADEETIAAHAAQASVKTLEEVMDQKGFRITEMKNFGRQEAHWYNGLTLVNKTTDTVFIMSGDVVTGGNQDRVNEEDLMALPGTIRNFPVFCVEHGRSYYYNPDAGPAEKKLAAFKGYYSVASPQVRKAVYEGDQEKVWNAVAQVTSANKAKSETEAYYALDREEAVRARCASYIDFFTEKFENLPNAVGMVAVMNGKIVGVEIFGHPKIFQRRLKELVHSYAIDAVENTSVQSSAPEDDNNDIDDAFRHVARKGQPAGKADATAGRFDFNGMWLHLYSK